MAKYAFFLGCIAPLRYPGIEKSTREVCKALGIELVDLKDASCCPAPGVIKAFSKTTWLAAAARNLALAEKMGLPIMTICNGCYGSLFDAAYELAEDKELLAEVNKILAEIGMEYKGTTKVHHFAEVLYKEVGVEKIKASFTKTLEYRIGVFYGCHFLKPSAIKQVDDPENPHILDDLIEGVCSPVIVKVLEHPIHALAHDRRHVQRPEAEPGPGQHSADFLAAVRGVDRQHVFPSHVPDGNAPSTCFQFLTSIRRERLEIPIHGILQPANGILRAGIAGAIP